MTDISLVKNIKSGKRICANIFCTNTFDLSGKKRFCSTPCKQAQLRFEKKAMADNPDVVLLPKKPTCALPGCAEVMPDFTHKYCCDAHKKKHWEETNKVVRQAATAKRNYDAKTYAIKASKYYYKLSDGHERIRFIETLLEISLDDEHVDGKVIRRLMRSIIMANPDKSKKELFYKNDPENYFTLTQIIGNYLMNYWGTTAKDFLKHKHFTRIANPTYNPIIDTPRKDAPQDDLPQFDDEEPAEENTTKKNFVDPVVYENIEKSKKRYEW